MNSPVEKKKAMETVVGAHLRKLAAQVEAFGVSFLSLTSTPSFDAGIIRILDPFADRVRVPASATRAPGRGHSSAGLRIRDLEDLESRSMWKGKVDLVRAAGVVAVCVQPQKSRCAHISPRLVRQNGITVLIKG